MCSECTRNLTGVTVGLDVIAKRIRNPRGEGALLRGEILRAAQTLLDESSGEAVTLRSVARRAGIAAPSIYRHFADRDALMRALVEDAFQELGITLTQARDRGEGEVARLRSVCAAYLRFAQERPHRYRLMFGGVWDASAAVEELSDTDGDRVRRLGMDSFDMLVRLIDDCVTAGSSSSSDPRRDAVALWVALHGYAGLRETTPLFSWPTSLDDTLVDDLARLRGGR